MEIGRRSGKTAAIREAVEREAATPADAEDAIRRLNEEGTVLMKDDRPIDPQRVRLVAQ